MSCSFKLVLGPTAVALNCLGKRADCTWGWPVVSEKKLDMYVVAVVIAAATVVCGCCIAAGSNWWGGCCQLVLSVMLYLQ